MAILIFVVILALIGVGLWTRKSAARTPVLVILCVGGLLAGVVKLLWNGDSNWQDSVANLEEAVGYGLGKAVAEAYPDGGTFAVLNLPPGLERPLPYASRFAGLQRALASDAYNLVELNPDDLPGAGHGLMEQLEAGQSVPGFQALLDQVPAPDALISLLGYPPLQTREEKLPVYLAAVFPEQAGWIADVPEVKLFVQWKDRRETAPKNASPETRFASACILVTP